MCFQFILPVLNLLVFFSAMLGGWLKQAFVLIVLFFVCMVAVGQNQKKLDNQRTKKWNVTIGVGTTTFLYEVYPDFNSINTEFKNNLGYTANIAFTKVFVKRLETGLGLDVSSFKGKNLSPEFSANGFHNDFIPPVTKAVKYSTQLLTPLFIARYHFREISPPKRGRYYLNGFIEAKVGIAFLFTELAYVAPQPDQSIFVKGKGRQPVPGFNALYSVGTGFRIDIDRKWGVLAIFDINMVNYDCLDAVHNYTISGSRLDLKGTYTRLMIGMSYSLNTKKIKKTPTNYPWTYNSN